MKKYLFLLALSVGLIMGFTVAARAAPTYTKYFAWSDWQAEVFAANQSPTYTYITFYDEQWNFEGQLQLVGFDTHRIGVKFPSAGWYKAFITVTEDPGSLPIVIDREYNWFYVSANAPSSDLKILGYDQADVYSGPGWLPVGMSAADWIDHEYILDFYSPPVPEWSVEDPYTREHTCSTSQFVWLTFGGTLGGYYRGCRIPDSTEAWFDLTAPFPHEL